MLKRISSAFICFCILVTLCSSFAYADDMTTAQKIAYYSEILGDADRNGTVDVTDARIALRIAVGLETNVSDNTKESADVDGVGGITVNDARNILRFAVGLSGFDLPLTKDEVVEYYVAAANNVKVNCPGFSGEMTSVCPTIKVSIPQLMIKNQEMKDVLTQLGQTDQIDSFYKPTTKNFIASQNNSQQHMKLFTVMGQTWSSKAVGSDVVSAKLSYLNGTYSITIKYGDFNYSTLPDDMTTLEYGRMFNVGKKTDYTEPDLGADAEGSTYTFNSISFKNGLVTCNINASNDLIKDVTYFNTSVLDSTITSTVDLFGKVDMNTVCTTDITIKYVMKAPIQ